MDLLSYIKQRKRIDKEFSARKMALFLDITYTHLSRICNYKVIPSLKLAIEIEKYTQGSVSGWELMKKCFYKSTNQQQAE